MEWLGPGEDAGSKLDKMLEEAIQSVRLTKFISLKRIIIFRDGVFDLNDTQVLHNE